jgi:hypothetical protein
MKIPRMAKFSGQRFAFSEMRGLITTHPELPKAPPEWRRRCAVIDMTT